MMQNTSLKYPYRRFFARLLDEAIYFLITALIFTKGFCIFFWEVLPATKWYLSILFMFLIEPICLALFGATVGKYIMGLRLGDQGKRLPYLKALRRTFLLFKTGMGFGIPLLEWYRYFKSWLACKDGESLAWDIEERYELKDTKRFRIVILAFMILAAIPAGSLLYAWAFSPLHHSPITVADFSENFMDLKNYCGVYEQEALDDKGVWSTPPYAGQPSIYSADMPNFQFFVEAGAVTGFTATQETETTDYIPVNKMILKLALMSYLGAEDSLSVFQPDYWRLIRKLEEENLDSFRMECGGNIIQCQWEVENGIYIESQDLLVPDNQETPIKYQMNLVCQSVL